MERSSEPGGRLRRRPWQGVSFGLRAPARSSFALTLALVLVSCTPPADDESAVGGTPSREQSTSATGPAVESTEEPSVQTEASPSPESTADVGTTDGETQDGSEADQGVSAATGSEGDDGDASPSSTVEDGNLPPGYYSPDTVLTEDAFDGPALELTRVELADGDAHELVFHLQGSGFPGWHVQYADPTDGSTPPSSSTLEITLTGVAASTQVDSLPSSQEVDLETDRTPDGDLVILLHLDQAAQPFRVHLQHAPLRFVVEVTKSG